MLLNQNSPDSCRSASPDEERRQNPLTPWGTVLSNEVFCGQCSLQHQHQQQQQPHQLHQRACSSRPANQQPAHQTATLLWHDQEWSSVVRSPCLATLPACTQQWASDGRSVHRITKGKPIHPLQLTASWQMILLQAVLRWSNRLNPLHA